MLSSRGDSITKRSNIPRGAVGRRGFGICTGAGGRMGVWREGGRGGGGGGLRRKKNTHVL